MNNPFILFAALNKYSHAADTMPPAIEPAPATVVSDILAAPTPAANPDGPRTRKRAAATVVNTVPLEAKDPGNNGDDEDDQVTPASSGEMNPPKTPRRPGRPRKVEVDSPDSDVTKASTASSPIVKTRKGSYVTPRRSSRAASTSAARRISQQIVSNRVFFTLPSHMDCA
ncbi:hypothetical protein M426DRAFT_221853 [Hypoxylon sp. CI-4A]|nr:hypothetical protein M426DRAFT_221853 [Hypoxylon sp. CI-4A]